MINIVDQDLELWKEIRKDNRLALNTLFAKYYQHLCVFANTYLKNPQEAEETVLEVFFNIWKQRESVVIHSNVKAYLFISTKNASLATIRRRQPLFSNTEEILFSTNLLDGNDPENILITRELQLQIETAIDQLPPRCKQIFLMSRMESLSYREIAEILNVAEKTVENQIIKSLALIREYLRHNDSIEKIPLTQA
ncbi:MAG: RNA polymerase sigma-70 factor [Cyclobacteriaceae bacterium]|nr:RNA polymerase sigma-70 factor [Cyclobacteriaceae bacterium]